MLQTNPQNYSAGWKECLNADVYRPSRMILLHPPHGSANPSKETSSTNNHPKASFTIINHPSPSWTTTIAYLAITILHHHHELSAAARLRIFFFVFNDLLAANVRRADLGPLDHGRPVRGQQPEDLSKLIKFELLYVRSEIGQSNKIWVNQRQFTVVDQIQSAPNMTELHNAARACHKWLVPHGARGNNPAEAEDKIWFCPDLPWFSPKKAIYC